MAVNTTGTAPKLLWPGLKALFGEEYAEKDMICRMVFDVMSSDKSYEEVQELTGLGLASVKAEANPITYDQDGQGYVTRFTNVTYGLGVQVTREVIRDNQYQNVAQRKLRKLARAMRVTKETVCANILNNAFTDASGGDGVALCATNHPTADGTQRNEPSTAVDFSEAALEDALIDIRDFTDSRGIRIMARPRKLIVPNELMFDAHRVLGSALQSGTANNDTNAIRSMGMLPVSDIIVWDYLTDPDAWFIKTDCSEGLMLFNRDPVELDRDNDFETKNQKMSATERYSVGWADWRGVWGSPGA